MAIASEPRRWLRGRGCRSSCVANPTLAVPCLRQWPRCSPRESSSVDAPAPSHHPRRLPARARGCQPRRRADRRAHRHGRRHRHRRVNGRRGWRHRSAAGDPVGRGLRRRHRDVPDRRHRQQPDPARQRRGHHQHGRRCRSRKRAGRVRGRLAGRDEPHGATERSARRLPHRRRRLPHRRHRQQPRPPRQPGRRDHHGRRKRQGGLWGRRGRRHRGYAQRPARRRRPCPTARS
jgi:hypothetical protein